MQFVLKVNPIPYIFSSLYKGKTRHIFADLTKPEDIEKMCREIKQFYPNGVDIIVNNAGKSKICY